MRLFRTHHAEKNAAAKKNDAVVLPVLSILETQLLGRENFQGSEEARDASLTWLLAIGHGLGRDVREGEADVDASEDERNKSHIEGSPDINGVSNHAAGY